MPTVKSEATRARILAATLRLIARKGERGVTYRAVGQASGAPLGVLTYHFPNRRALVRAAYELHLARTRERAEQVQRAYGDFARAFDADDPGIWEAIAAFALGANDEEREHLVADFQLALDMTRDPTLERELAEARDATSALARDLIARAGSTSPDDDTPLIIAAIQGLALEAFARPSDQAFRDDVPRLVRVLFTKLMRP